MYAAFLVFYSGVEKSESLLLCFLSCLLDTRAGRHIDALLYAQPHKIAWFYGYAAFSKKSVVRW